MNKKIFLYGAILISISIFLSGCQEEATVTDPESDITLISNVAELAYSNIDIEYNKTGAEIAGVTVEWRLRTIVDKIISAEIIIGFYDENDIELYTETKQLLNAPPRYTEQLITPANTVLYDGPGVSQYDHIIIYVNEIPNP